MPLSEENRRKLEELARDRAAEAGQRPSEVIPPPMSSAEQPPEQTQQNTQSYSDVAASAQKSTQERGAVTATGEFLNDALDYISDGGLGLDAQNALAAGLNQLSGGNLQGLDDAVKGYEETEQIKDQVIEDLENPLVNALEGVSGGQKAAMLTPVTVAARIANQDSSEWAEPPAVVKDSLEGQLAFEISRLLTTAVLAQPAVGALGGVGGATGARALESAAETLNQRSADDLMFGKEQAQLMGQAAEHLGLVEDGRELTRRLIAGEDVDAQVMVGIAGFLQNYTFNTVSEKLLSRVGKLLGNAEPSKTAKEVAEATGKDAEAVQLSLDDIETPPVSKDYEPHELQTPDTQVPVSTPSRGLQAELDEAILFGQNTTDELIEQRGRQMTADAWEAFKTKVRENPSKIKRLNGKVEALRKKLDYNKSLLNTLELEGNTSGNEALIAEIRQLETKLNGKTYINEEALVAEVLKRKGLSSDGLDAADRNYFAQFRNLNSEQSYGRALEEATDTVAELMKTGAKDREKVLYGAQRWLNQFISTTDSSIDVDRAVNVFSREMTEGAKRKGFNSQQAMRDAFNSDVPKRKNPGLDTKGKPMPASAQRYVDYLLRENKVTTPEGAVAATVIGEEMSVRLSQAARQAMNLDTAGVDFTKAVENFLDIQNTADLFLVPLRRANRKWAVDGFVRQKDNVKRVKDADIKRLNDTTPPSYEGPGSEFQTSFRVDPESPVDSARELWSRYQGGDYQAGETLKAYLGTIAYADPKNAISQLDSLSKTLKDQLKQGNTDATRQLFYSYQLTRLSPQSASLNSNIFGLIREPLGLILSGERAMGLGRIVGGAAGWSDSLQNAAQAFKTGQGLNSGSKIDIDAKSFQAKDLQLDQTWQGVRKELIAEGKSWNSPEMVTSWLSYTRQKIANKPIMSVAARALLAQDEWAKTIYGTQVAAGRAWKEAAESNIKRGTAEFEKLVSDHTKEVFRDGVKTGKIIDDEVLLGAKGLTFQRDIPREGNIVDRAFAALEDGARNSAFWNWVTPYTRMSYNTLEQGGQVLAGSLGPAGKWLLTRIPRYQKILNGEMGEVAQLQLKSNLAFAQHWMFVAGALGTMGFATGNNPPPGMPRRSFIVPMPGSKDGWVGIPYDRIEPMATPTSIIVDLVQGLRDEVITQGDYNKFATEMLYSLGVGTLDKGFTSSLTQSAALFDIKNFSEGTVSQGVNALTGVGAAVLPVGAYGGIARMVTDWANPYQTVNRVNDDSQEQFWLSFRQRIVGGAGNPIRYDVLSDPKDVQPIPKVAQVGNNDGTYWRATLGTFFDELLIPGRSSNAPKDDFVRQQMDSVGFTRDLLEKNIRTFDSIPLSADQQSTMSYDIAAVGKLRERLEVYFKGDEFKRLKKGIEDFRSDTAVGSTSTGTRSAEFREAIHQDINAIFSEAKEMAGAYGQLAQDEEFQIKRIASQQNLPIPQVRAQRSAQQRKVDKLLDPTKFYR